MPEPILEMDDRLARTNLPLCLAVRGLDIVGVNEIDERCGAQLGEVIAERGRPRGVETDEISGGAGGCEEVRGDLEKSIKFLECCPSALFSQPGVAGTQPDHDR